MLSRRWKRNSNFIPLLLAKSEFVREREKIEPNVKVNRQARSLIIQSSNSNEICFEFVWFGDPNKSKAQISLVWNDARPTEMNPKWFASCEFGAPQTEASLEGRVCLVSAALTLVWPDTSKSSSISTLLAPIRRYANSTPCLLMGPSWRAGQFEDVCVCVCCSTYLARKPLENAHK